MIEKRMKSESLENLISTESQDSEDIRKDYDEIEAPYQENSL
jgi:hypothetical protein